jgi:hypothetical protein
MRTFAFGNGVRQHLREVNMLVTYALQVPMYDLGVIRVEIVEPQCYISTLERD